MPHYDGLPCPSATYAAARRSSHGRAHQTTWGQLRRALTRHDRARADKLDAPCWAPHVASDGRRLASAIVSVHALVLDFDDGADVPAAMSLFPTRERCAYSTYSATPEAPRCRLVLPLAAPVAGHLWAAAMRLILRDVGQAESAADPKCIDPSRLYLLPCRGPVEVADYAEGDLLDLSDYVARAEYEAELARLHQEQARARSQARAVAARRWAAQGPDDEARAERAGRAALRSDPDARARVAADLRAKVVTRDGARVAIGLPCPGCGRPDVWFLIDPRAAWSARCNHVKTCGWHGQIADLLAAHGLRPHAYGAL